jgi:glycosyltransferase involved in cell wall biosynthesis
MPKVLLIVNRFNIGGLVLNVALLEKYLKPEFETMLIGGVPDKEESDCLYMLEALGVKATVIESLQRKISFANDRKAYKKIIAIIKEYQPDIVHTHASKAGALGRIAAKKCNVPIILHTFHGHVFHSYFGKTKTFVYKNIERWLSKKSTGIIAISEQQKKELSTIHKICKPEKTHVIPYGFELDKFGENFHEKRTRIRTQYNIDENEVAIAIIGRLVPIKDHSFFLEVIQKMLSNENLPIKVFIVGNGSEWNPIQTEVERINLNFGNKILMTSWITDIPIFNAGMDIIALTSKNEGTPMSIIEAQATGVATISTNVGGVADVMLENESGFIIPKGDVDLYCEKLAFLIKNKEIREKMSQNGKNFVQNKFGYKTLIKNTSDYYMQLLNKIP